MPMLAAHEKKYRLGGSPYARFCENGHPSLQERGSILRTLPYKERLLDMTTPL
jgi:hypothetical protein